MTPHEVARARALSRNLKGYYFSLIAVAGRQADYKWPYCIAPDGFSSQVLFPDSDFWKVTKHELKPALWNALRGVRPHVVALAGWGFKSEWLGLQWCIQHKIPRVLISDSQRT
ncbi:MAG: hypothetical protein ACYC6M_03260, partial [Terriglobales bacterium]